MGVDEGCDIALEVAVVATLPLWVDLERVLGVDDEQGGLGERHFIYGQHW
jgi:hypothetical protein